MTHRPLELAAEALAAADDLTQTDRLIYLGLARRADNDTLECFPSRADLAAFAGVGDLDTVSRSLRRLEKVGLCTRLHRAGRTTVYVLTPRASAGGQLSTTPRASAGGTPPNPPRQRGDTPRASAGTPPALARGVTTKRTTHLTGAPREPSPLPCCGGRFSPGTGAVHEVDCPTRTPPPDPDAAARARARAELGAFTPRRGRRARATTR